MTTAVERYRAVKKEHPDRLLLMRVGDFYEALDRDAVELALAFELHVTWRWNGPKERVPMAGIPYHQVSHCIESLLAHGRTVALLEPQPEGE